MISVDLDGDPSLEQIVGSIVDDGGYHPAGTRADLVEIYDRDEEAGVWQLVYRDSIDWITGWQLAELTGDDRVDLLLSTTGGGNEPIAAEGMTVISGQTDTIATFWQRTSGMPRLATVDDRNIIVIHELFWPEFLPHAAALPVIAEVLSMTDGRAGSDYATSRRFFAAQATEATARVERLLGGGGTAGTSDDDQARADLFRAAIEALAAYRGASSDTQEQRFRNDILPLVLAALDEDRRMILEDVAAEGFMMSPPEDLPERDTTEERSAEVEVSEGGA